MRDYNWFDTKSIICDAIDGIVFRGSCFVVVLSLHLLSLLHFILCLAVVILILWNVECFFPLLILILVLLLIYMVFLFFFLLFNWFWFGRHAQTFKPTKPLECISSITKSRLPGSITSIRFTSADIWNGSNFTRCSSNSNRWWPKYRSTCDSWVAVVSSFVGHFASNISALW